MTADADFDAAFRRHYGAVLRYAARRVDASEAHDVAADVFVVAWRRRHQNGAPLELPWLLGVARLVVANHHRARTRAVALTVRAAQQPPPSSSDFAEQVTVLDTWTQALAALSADDQQVLALIAWDGLTVREAAEVLGCTAPTLSMRLSRARRRLRQQLRRHQSLAGDTAYITASPSASSRMGVPDA